MIRSPDFSCDGIDHRGHLALPEQEDRALVVGERLVERLAEHRAQAAPVAAGDVQGDVAAGLAPGNGADVEEERTAVPARIAAVVSDECRGGRRDVGERRSGLRADRDLDVVAGLQVADRDDMRDARRPAEELGLGTGRERLVLALPDQRPERGVVAALDLDLDRVGAGREQLAAELVQPALAAAGRGRSNDGARECREGDGDDQAVLHGRSSWVIRVDDLTMSAKQQVTVPST